MNTLLPTAVLCAGLLMAAACSSSDPDPRPEPAGHSPADSATATAPVNGRITSAQRHLGAPEAYNYHWRSFDPTSGTGLFVVACERFDCGDVEGVTVIGTAGPLATLTCPGDLPCIRNKDYISYAAGLGPGADEVTVESEPGTARVIGYDGRVRRTVDLTVSLPPGEEIRRLAWSPDGTRLAVLTAQPGEAARDIWFADRSGEARLAYSSPSPVWSLGGWSPDGQSLLVDQYVGETGADVVVLRQGAEDSPEGVTPQTLYRSDRHFDWAGNLAWSPDGSRVAVRTSGSIVQISAKDGSVLARRTHINGWLIWLRKDG